MAYLLDLSAYAAMTKRFPEYETQEWTSKLVVLSGEIMFGHRVVGISARNHYVTDFKPRLLGTEDVPTRIQLESRPKQFPPFVRGHAAMWGVREDVRSLIESFEPGTHQFIEVELSDGRGHRADQKYFYLNILQYFEAILIERSPGIELLPKATVQGVNNDIPIYTNCIVKKKEGMVASSQKICNRHLWRSWLVPHCSIFCSDELWHALREAKVTRLLDATHVPEVGAPWGMDNAMEQILAAQLAYRRKAQE